MAEAKRVDGRGREDGRARWCVRRSPSGEERGEHDATTTATCQRWLVIDHGTNPVRAGETRLRLDMGGFFSVSFEASTVAAHLKAPACPSPARRDATAARLGSRLLPLHTTTPASVAPPVADVPRHFLRPQAPLCSAVDARFLLSLPPPPGPLWAQVVDSTTAVPPPRLRYRPCGSQPAPTPRPSLGCCCPCYCLGCASSSLLPPPPLARVSCGVEPFSFAWIPDLLFPLLERHRGRVLPPWLLSRSLHPSAPLPLCRAHLLACPPARPPACYGRPLDGGRRGPQLQHRWRRS